jgi:hypothetical protein
MGSGGELLNLAQAGPRFVLFGAIPIGTQAGLAEQRRIRCLGLKHRNQEARASGEGDALLGADVALLVDLALDRGVHYGILPLGEVRPTPR